MLFSNMLTLINSKILWIYSMLHPQDHLFKHYNSLSNMVLREIWMFQEFQSQQFKLLTLNHNHKPLLFKIHSLLPLISHYKLQHNLTSSRILLQSNLSLLTNSFLQQLTMYNNLLVKFKLYKSQEPTMCKLLTNSPHHSSINNLQILCILDQQ